ncbi:MAG: protein kinase domain-containing protein [Planctomycetota bacterium]|jgi:serine/threonine protein kinase
MSLVPRQVNDSTQQFEQPAPKGDGPAFVDLVAACLERIEEDGSAALEAFCREHPQHEEALRRVVSELSASGMLESAEGGDADMFPDRLGEFHLLERIGVGGMGVVYRAEQGSLRRQVALKLIRPDYLYFPGAKQRLQREVEAVARLDHPGIVSVLTVGEDGGIPYFAMEFVNGCSVAQVLRELKGQDPKTLTGANLQDTVQRLCPDPTSRGDAFGSPQLFQGTWAEACTRVARMVAEALDHAHERGIVHRDIKPSNVMLTPGGRVLVVDFGLATLQAAPKLTQTGSTLGSLAYMAPEMVRGDAHDERIDVYSLGVTLYEMLTLRHAFEGDDAAAVQTRILEANVENPRNINGAVTRDLETVCLAAMEPDPGRRYPRCGDFADDLTNLLERRPVLARRAGPLLRAVRWVQRHKAATAALVAVVVVPLFFLFQQMAANRQIDVALQKAQENYERSQQNFGTALAAVDRLLGRMSHKTLRHVPQMSELRWNMLQDTLKFCEELLAKEPDNVELLRRTAYTASVFGSLSMYRGKREEARESFERAMVLYDELVSLSPADRLTPVGKVCDYAAVVVDLGDPGRALDLCDKALAWCDRFTEEDNKDGKAAAVRALINRQRGMALHFLGRPEERDEAIAQCIADMEEVVKQHPGYVNHRFELGKTYILQGNHAVADKHLQEAVGSYVRAEELLEVVARELPKNQDAHASVGRALNRHTHVLMLQHSYPEMEKISRRAAAIFARLVKDYPQILDFHSNLGTAHHHIALALVNQRRPREAEPEIAKAIAAQQHAYDRRPDSARYGQVLANHYYLQSIIRSRLGDHAGVRESVESFVRYRPKMDAYVSACGMLSLCVKLARRDKSLNETDRARLVDAYGTAAEDQLEAGVKAGFRNADAVRASDLDHIRERPRFRRILTQIRELQESGK